MNRALKLFRLALSSLTMIPIRFGPGEVTVADLAASRHAFLAVGLAIGLMMAALSLTLDRLGAPGPVAAVVLVAALAILSGGLHLDGLADTFDGLFLGGDRTRRLAAMRDPHVGSFGVSALVLTLLGKFAALEFLHGRTRALAILGACAVGRALILIPAGLSRYARPDGTGRVVIEAASPADAHLAFALVLLCAVGSCGSAGFVAGLATLGLAWGLTHLANRNLGGVTGDVLGALVELGEVVFLTTLTLHA